MKKINVIINVLLVIAALSCTVIAVWRIRSLSDETAMQKAKLEAIENEVNSIKEKEKLKGKLELKCSDKTLVFGAVNGIKKEDLGSLKVTTPYQLTLYQVIGKEEGKEEKVLQNNKVESNTKIKTFKLEGLTEDVTEIRLFGFEENQLTSQTYEIVFLELD